MTVKKTTKKESKPEPKDSNAFESISTVFSMLVQKSRDLGLIVEKFNISTKPFRLEVVISEVDKNERNVSI